MLLEVECAASFVSDLSGLPDVAKASFRSALSRLMQKRFHGHWFPEKPTKGSAFRCVSLDHAVVDAIVTEAADAARIERSALLASLPAQLAVWVDPGNVSYRIGDQGSVCYIYSAPQVSSSVKSTNESPSSITSSSSSISRSSSTSSMSSVESLAAGHGYTGRHPNTYLALMNAGMLTIKPQRKSNNRYYIGGRK